MAIRKMLCRACEELSARHDAEHHKAGGMNNQKNNKNGARGKLGFIPLQAIKAKMDQLSQGTLQPVLEKEVLDICETEGNETNGGGSFDLRHDQTAGQTSIRWVMGNHGSRTLSLPVNRAVGAPGEISSPIVGSGVFHTTQQQHTHSGGGGGGGVGAASGLAPGPAVPGR